MLMYIYYHKFQILQIFAELLTAGLKHRKKPDTRLLIWNLVNPPRLIRLREYRRGFQTPHELSLMPATLGRNGYLTPDTVRIQWLRHAVPPSAGAEGFALFVRSTA